MSLVLGLMEVKWLTGVLSIRRLLTDCTLSYEYTLLCIMIYSHLQIAPSLFMIIILVELPVTNCSQDILPVLYEFIPFV